MISAFLTSAFLVHSTSFLHSPLEAQGEGDGGVGAGRGVDGVGDGVSLAIAACGTNRVLQLQTFFAAKLVISPQSWLHRRKVGYIAAQPPLVPAAAKGKLSLQRSHLQIRVCCYKQRHFAATKFRRLYKSQFAAAITDRGVEDGWWGVGPGVVPRL